MQKTFYLLTIIIFALVLMPSCDKEEPFVPNPDDPGVVDPTDPDPDPDTSTWQSSQTDAFKAEVLAKVNELRSSGRNCGSNFAAAAANVTWNNLLEQSAERHTNDMVSNNHFSHIGTDNSTSAARISGTGYNCQACGETIASGFSNVDAVFAAWIASPSHCDIIMDSNYKEIGLFFKNGYWTMNAGTTD